MLRRYYRSIGRQLALFGWGRGIVVHVERHAGFYENFEALFTALFLALIIKRFVVEAYRIPSKSMMDTLLVHDRIFVNKFIYTFAEIDAGDVVVFRVPTTIPNYDPEKPYYIKRVVGTAGDRIEIRDDYSIYRNGERLTDPPFFAKNRYFSDLRGLKFSPVTIPEGEILVFGDNSRDSYDGRYWGCLPAENVMGKAFFRYWPVSRFGLIQDESKNPQTSSSGSS